MHTIKPNLTGQQEGSAGQSRAHGSQTYPVHDTRRLNDTPLPGYGGRSVDRDTAHQRRRCRLPVRGKLRLCYGANS